MSESYNKLISTLQTIFEMDKADLDFGIYRIMNQKRDDINKFLEHDLLPQVKQAFAVYAHDGQDDLQKELETVIEQARKLGAPDPENTEAAQEIKKKLASAVDATALENDVFSKLHTFFSRYYDKGDFISQRRYKKDTYAIPYEGEEVKLYWANHDQYYIKSSEHLRDYAFIAKDEKDKDKSFRIKLVEADIAKDNVKAKSGEERRFVLDEETPLRIVDGELLIHFNFIPVGKKKQDTLNKTAVEIILKQQGDSYVEWLSILKTPAPIESNKDRTLLEKHLNDYTARNTFDYFIHKDLGGFLNRELDFFIKNEVMYLDDIDDAAFEVTEQQIRKIKILRSIAKKIIRMLAQLEDFQKMLWLKKKFVVETTYCISLDRVPNELYTEIAEEEKQWNEWMAFSFINDEQAKIDNRLKTLTSNKGLVLDTQYFNQDFLERLLSSIDNVDSGMTGLLINSENFQAINFINASHKNKIKVILTDPPYNSGGDDFAYKDSFRNSSWLSMLNHRIEASRDLMSEDGVFFVHIDDKDEDNRVSHRLMNLVEDKFGTKNYLDNLIWVKNTTHNDAKVFSHNHEYIIAFAKNRTEASSKHKMFRENKPGYAEVMDLVHELNPKYPSIKDMEKRMRQLYSDQSEQYKQECLKQGLEWNSEVKKNNPWKGITQYKRVDYRTDDGAWVNENNAMEAKAKLWVWREDNPAWPNAGSLTLAHKSKGNPDFRFYNPIHPKNKKKCPAPKSGWRWRQNPNPEKPDTKSFMSLCDNHLIAFGENESKIPQYKRFLHDVETNVVKSVFNDFTDGEKELANIIGERGTFSNPKPTTIGRRLVEITTDNGDLILDLFAGSGTLGHAILQQNFIDEKERKFILIEMGEHFNYTLLPRIKKCSYSTHWKDGEPESQGHQSVFIKSIRLEGYEDTLNNLQLMTSKQQQPQLAQHDKLREDYMLGYWLDVETVDSPSLLNIDQFEDPFNYKLNIGSGSVGATKSTTVDLVETFNYLIGLTVKTIDLLDGFKVVTGTNPQDESVLVVWRNTKEKDNEALEKFL